MFFGIKKQAVLCVGVARRDRKAITKLNPNVKFFFRSIQDYKHQNLPALPSSCNQIVFNTQHSNIAINRYLTQADITIHSYKRCVAEPIGGATEITLFRPERFWDLAGDVDEGVPRDSEALLAAFETIQSGIESGNREGEFFTRFEMTVARAFALLSPDASLYWFRRYVNYWWEAQQLNEQIISLVENVIQALKDSGYQIPPKLNMDYLAMLASVGQYNKIRPQVAELKKKPQLTRNYLGLTAYLSRRTKSPVTPLAPPLYQRLSENEHLFRKLVNKADGDVRIVCNGPYALGKNMGEAIDRAGLVVRFNSFTTSFPLSQDYGTKTDIWVRMIPHPYVSREPDLSQLQMVMITGANRLERSYANWEWFYQHADRMPGLCFTPSQPFIELCDAIGRIPSSGLLLSYMLYREIGPLPEHTVIGASFVQDAQERDEYHYAEKNALPSSRHSIEREKAFFKTLLNKTETRIYTPLDASKIIPDSQASAPDMRRIDQSEAGWDVHTYLGQFDTVYTTSKGLIGYAIGDKTICEYDQDKTKLSQADLVVGFGLRGSATKAKKVSETSKAALALAEYGLISGIATPSKTPFKFSLMLDDIGIYFDTTKPSRTLRLLEEDSHLNGSDTCERVRAFIDYVFEHNIVKYNSAPYLELDASQDKHKILVIDQTKEDLAIMLGGCDRYSFKDMLEHALAQEKCEIYLKLHPETVEGSKEANFKLDALNAYSNLHIIRQNCNNMHLVKQMDEIYVMTSGAGLEGLMAGKKVRCFGQPFYSGWGITEDMHPISRCRTRSLEEIVESVFFRQTLWFDPKTHAECSPEQALQRLVEIRGKPATLQSIF